MRNKIKNLITKKNSIDRQEFNVKTRNTRVITTFLEKKKKKKYSPAETWTTDPRRGIRLTEENENAIEFQLTVAIDRDNEWPAGRVTAEGR